MCAQKGAKYCLLGRVSELTFAMLLIQKTLQDDRINLTAEYKYR